MPPSVAASPARVLTDITATSQQRENRSCPSPLPPVPTTPQKACRASPSCKVQPAHCASPPSSFRQPQPVFSSPASNRRTAPAPRTQTTDSFTQWMDAVLPLVHSAPADEPEEEAEEQADDDSSMQPYVAINPALLHDNRWAYRDLQLLCQRLGLGGRGDRLHLIHKLRTWNRTHFSSSNLPATAASNFALLCINSGGDKYAAQLTPLKVKTPRLCDGSPRSALSGGRAGVVTGAGSQGRRLSFSVFNGVKLIPARALQYEDDDEKAEDEHEERREEAQVQKDQGRTALSRTEQEQQSATIKSEASGSTQCTDVPLQQQTSKGNDDSDEQQARKKLESVSVRRSARKRVPSRRLRDSQC